MDRVQNAAQSVTVICVQSCSVPKLSVIAHEGEYREVSGEEADILVSTGRFKTVAIPAKPVSKAKKVLTDEIEDLSAEEEIDATPAAERLAKENGIDLSHIVGTGSEGTILKSDVIAYMEDSK